MTDGCWLITSGAIDTPPIIAEAGSGASGFIDPCNDTPVDNSLIRVFVPIMAIMFMAATL